MTTATAGPGSAAAPPASVDVVAAEQADTAKAAQRAALRAATALPTITLDIPRESAQEIKESRVTAEATGAMLVICIWAAVLVVTTRESVDDSARSLILTFAGTMTLVVATVVAARLRILTTRLTSHDRDQAATDTAAPGPDPALQEQSRAIAQQVAIYQHITTRQAKTAFRSSVTATTIGLLVLVSGASLAYRAQDDALRAVLGTSTTVGVALATFLGKTFLDMLRRANEQLNRSHAVPLAQHLAFFVFMLANEADPGEERNQMVHEIVSTTLKGVELTLAGFLKDSVSMPADASAGGQA